MVKRNGDAARLVREQPRVAILNALGWVGIVLGGFACFVLMLLTLLPVVVWLVCRGRCEPP